MGAGEGHPKRQGSLWHESFYACITERAPPGFEVRSEVPLSLRPRRADLLLLRRQGEPRRDDEARILRGLWSRLPAATLVEFKSPTRGTRRSELLRLLGYGLQYHERAWRELAHRSDLTLVLVVASLNQALVEDLASLDCELRPLGGGYAEMVGFLYTTYVVYTDEVAEAEQDDFLRIFSHHEVQTPDANHWFQHWIAEKDPMSNMRQYEGYDEMVEKFARTFPAETILRHIKPEERLAGLSPEERVAGLTREQQILALPDDVLRGLSAEYVQSLPQDVQETIRQRLGKAR